MRKALILTAGMLVGVVMLLAGCNGRNAVYKDGTYTGQSSADDKENGYGVVTIKIENGTVASCEFLTYNADGSLKDEDYGKENGRIVSKDFYNKAQKANAACAEYANMLVSSGNLEGVDAVSGATVNYNLFIEAVNNALEGAKE
ncbi:MAG: FMN-binding protein [Lachnospiraceae bacterium]|nr:FMN-binding protein [Lachnospiraceae bacterium]